MNVISLRQVVQLTNLSESTILRLEKDGKFPARQKLSVRRIGWLEEEVRSWILKRSRVKRSSL